MKKEVNTFAEYMADTERITDAEREQINFQVAVIGKMIEAREERGLSQRELAKLSGVK